MEVLIKDEFLDKALKALNVKYRSHKYFNDGTYSKVLLLNDTYIVKQSNPKAIQAEVEFLKQSSYEKMQKPIYVDNNNDFAIYGYISGSIMKTNNFTVSIDELIDELISITNGYRPYESSAFGHLFNVFSTWSDFLKDEVLYSQKTTKELIPNYNLVYNCISNLEKYSFTPKLLHGDLGTHNLIQNNNKLSGVIDPMTIIGDPLYDLLSALVSNIKILDKISLEFLYKKIDEPKDKINNMLIIVTYIRIAKCLKYHKNDINVYMNFWNSLTENI